MKNIHEILAAMGIEVPAEKMADLDKELLANYRTLADYEMKNPFGTVIKIDVRLAELDLKCYNGVQGGDGQDGTGNSSADSK